MTGGVRVRGNATAEELAAVFAALAERPALTPYERWRRTRIAALSRPASAPPQRAQ